MCFESIMILVKPQHYPAQIQCRHKGTHYSQNESMRVMTLKEQERKWCLNFASLQLATQE